MQVEFVADWIADLPGTSGMFSSLMLVITMITRVRCAFSPSQCKSDVSRSNNDRPSWRVLGETTENVIANTLADL